MDDVFTTEYDMQTQMSRQKLFNMRMSDEEWARFEVVAKSYDLPVASMLRMLVKEKHDAIAALKLSDEPEAEHRDVLFHYACPASDGTDTASLSTGEIAREMNGSGYDAKWGGLPRVLNWLCREGFLKRRSGTGESWDGKYIYEITAKGRAYCQGNWNPAGTEVRHGSKG